MTCNELEYKLGFYHIICCFIFSLFLPLRLWVTTSNPLHEFHVSICILSFVSTWYWKCCFKSVSLDINECGTSSPCGEHGTCNNTVGSYYCLCENGWTGEHCDTGEKFRPDRWLNYAWSPFKYMNWCRTCAHRLCILHLVIHIFDYMGW